MAAKSEKDKQKLRELYQSTYDDLAHLEQRLGDVKDNIWFGEVPKPHHYSTQADVDDQHRRHTVVNQTIDEIYEMRREILEESRKKGIEIES